jgi:hypothetical protein
MNPLLLFILIVLSVLIILLLIFKTKKQRIILFALVAVTAAGGGWYGYKEYTRSNTDLTKVKADVSITAAVLVKEYEINDSSANKKYSGKIIETEGSVKSIEKDDKGYYTVVLGDEAGMSSIRCSMDTTHQQDAARLTVGSSAVVRGVCTGFNKDEMGLGSDVFLIRSVIIQNKK